MTELNRPPGKQRTPKFKLTMALGGIMAFGLLLVLLYILSQSASAPQAVRQVTDGSCPNGQGDAGSPPAVNPPAEPISQAFKGFTLSSACWDGEWYFTLDEGLNAVRPCTVPTSPSVGGVRSYTVKGIDGLKAMLAQLPDRAYVTWCEPERGWISSRNAAPSSTVDNLLPDSAMTAWAVTPDDSLWFAFDQFDDIGGTPSGSQLQGLYRLRGGQLSHFDIPGTIRLLKAAPDGSLYVGAGCGVMRYAGEAWLTLLELDCNRRTAVTKLFPLDIAFARDGLIWVGGAFSLASFDGDAWIEYDIPAQRVVIASDQSVWTRGWDGRANSNCCLTHITDTQWTTYTWTADIAVEPELLESLLGQPGR